jgi:hypothetical protein
MPSQPCHPTPSFTSCHLCTFIVATDKYTHSYYYYIVFKNQQTVALIVPFYHHYYAYNLYQYIISIDSLCLCYVCVFVLVDYHH